MRACDECQDLGYCRKLQRCIRREIPHFEDEEAMKEYGRGVQELLRRQSSTRRMP